MTGNSASFTRFGLAELKTEAKAEIERFDPRKIAYLTQDGKWRENPQTLRDRISHELFFHLWKRGKKEAAAFVDAVLSRLQDEDCGRAFLKLGAALMRAETAARAASPAADDTIFDPEQRPYLVIHEVLLWLIRREMFRLNAEAFAPDWNSEARLVKAEFQANLRSLDDFARRVLTDAESQNLFEVAAGLVNNPVFPVATVAALLAEEIKISEALERLVTVSVAHPQKEEFCSAIIEKIQPPTGIVSHLSPALFFPCLRLLGDTRIDLASGIPYTASVMLSIFQDPRSAEALFSALKSCPLSCTKIRENIIYTLGNLKEGRVVEDLIAVLEAPDEITASAAGGKTACLLLEQKEEAIWALGKIGLASLKAIPALATFADHPSARLKTYLAWTLGEVGKAQREATGGVSADVVISLLKLLKHKNKQIFEETAGALKKIGLPEFVHSLYLYHAGAISILGLKPAQRGLYELSETVHHLLHTKRTAVMAVNGDSGTGKTYFCQAIAEGFSGLKPDEILYLMRDTKRGQKVFNRLLGLRWLKKHIDPAYYQDYPLSEEEDAPDAFFRQFLEENSGKRLIILDGCRDRHYFQKVIDFFYNEGKLDIEVNFRARFSTRRLNLEEREVALESVKLHLAFLEEPSLEDTSFYQEDLVILYDLDNSHGSRLNRQETKELFEERRIDSWGELIRIGDFSGEKEAIACREQPLVIREEDFEGEEEDWPEFRVRPFASGEKILGPILNEDLKAEPNLLMAIPLYGLDPRRILFYAQDQIAGIAGRGTPYVFTLLDNRIFSFDLGEDVADLAILGRTLYLAAPGRGFFGLSFENDEVAEIMAGEAAPLKIACFPPDRIVVASADGRIRILDFLEKRIIVLAGPRKPVTSLAVDQRGRICAGDESGGLAQWDLEKRQVRRIEGMTMPVRFLRTYPFGKILAVEGPSHGYPLPRFHIIDIEGSSFGTIPFSSALSIGGVSVYFDGRVIVALETSEEIRAPAQPSLVVIAPKDGGCSRTSLSGHARGTRDCLAMGPKIITCGVESDGRSAFRVWGSEFYVRMELGKLRIKP
jgi:WD40 repeat protein